MCMCVCVCYTALLQVVLDEKLGSPMTPLPSVMVGRDPSDTLRHSAPHVDCPGVPSYGWASVDRQMKDTHTNRRIYQQTHFLLIVGSVWGVRCLTVCCHIHDNSDRVFPHLV